jgi:hypothetical protein
VVLIRLMLGLIVAAMAGICAMPLLVLLDLAGGGSGWGLCPEGINSCRTSYFDGPELLGMLALALFFLLVLLRLTWRLMRSTQERRRGP